ncbi:putative NAD(P)/FAD-binding protein YdhS [Krasilnikovia cinnamomea]|uniref:Putative NAD(P)/FAD-binding protein YdhS n=1 Tax=Krasilnikovia cinnamomea TaxID=349313 RepID=A0A4Q7ZER2_9ACTN|nr:FAD/NAD(P)-binding protein [Krasilnikovia cinnamomea]RZU49220.1 putative NAD(P)/FAD-binding protein YdhS [Krasilnikovia cinnamomea]
MGRRTVVVVGGGCAGVLAAREVLRAGDDDVVLIEPGQLGGGIAYGAAQPWHLLNSRAGAMSADPDDPGHFVRWARERGLGADPDAFLSRHDYGRYLRDAFDEAVAAHPGRCTVRRAPVRSLYPGRTGVAVSLADGTIVFADHVILAVGGPAGARPPGIPARLAGHPAYVADPWRPGALAAIPERAPVLLVGTGLTAVDIALTLTADGGGRTVVAVSRRGRLPLSHTATAAPPTVPALAECRTLRDVVRTVRACAGQAGDWRTVVDGLRPHLDRLWCALSPAEQDAFLRHLARPWECHRHRMAPQVAERIAALRAAGALAVRAGGLAGLAPAPGGGLMADLDGRARRFAAIVNCTGPGRLPGAALPLVGALLRAGFARVGPHGLGLDIDPAGRVVAGDGSVQPRLWLVGPLRRGALWETTAVPEIRTQARGIAVDLSSTGALKVAA